MNQFEFDLDSFDAADSLEVTGCIRGQNLYPLSAKDSTIRVVFENLYMGCAVHLDVTDHPARWQLEGEVPVSLTLIPEPLGIEYTGKNLRLLNSYSSLEHLPYKFIPVRKLLVETQQWIDCCPYQPLKAFMYQVLGTPSVGSLFFRIPVTARRHFSEPGGLAKHSLEVAQIVHSSTLHFPEHERWLAATAGLLHEVGRVRMYADDNRLKETSSFVSHEVLSFEVLGPALLELEKSWSDGAESIRHMFDNLCRVRRNSPLLPITSSIRSADLMSMMNNQRELAFQGTQQSEKFARVGNSASEIFWQPSAP